MKTVKALISLKKNNVEISLHLTIKPGGASEMMSDVLNGIPDEYLKNNARLVSIFFFEEETK